MTRELGGGGKESSRKYYRFVKERRGRDAGCFQTLLLEAVWWGGVVGGVCRRVGRGPGRCGGRERGRSRGDPAPVAGHLRAVPVRTDGSGGRGERGRGRCGAAVHAEG